MHNDIILAHIEQPDHLFVFPSEVAGEFCLREVLQSSSRRAIRRDRFISWDRLKEREFSPAQTRSPANSVYRLLFAAGLLDEHRQRGPLLHYLLGDTGAGGEADSGAGEAAARPGAPTGFQRQLALSLPQLQHTYQTIESRPGMVPAELEQDIRTLYQRYREFLDSAGLFEPAFVPPEAARPRHVYHIFYPELIEDYREYQHLIDGDEHFISHFTEASPQSATCVRFENARQELDYLVSKLDNLLEDGVHPADIAVTLPEFDEWMPYLSEEAEIRNVPLDFRSGRTLAEYPAGRLFSRVAALSANGFGLEHLKRVVLEPAYPLKDKAKWHELVRFAIDHYYVRSWTGDGAVSDELDRKLKLNGRQGLRSLYRNFRHQIALLISSPDFEELQKRVHKFVRTFFDTGAWEPETEKVLQYCLLVLGELQRAAESVGGVQVSDPYGLWLSLLNERIYVSAVRKEAIPVYKYRVSAGITPQYHFIPGAGQAQTRVRHEELTFLREDYRSKLLEGDPVDMSAAFLSTYAQSGGTVEFSCSDTGFASPQLPPGELLAAESVVDAPSAGEGPAAADLFAREEAYWSGAQDFPPRLYPVQQRGFDYMRQTGFTAKGKDYSRQAVDEPQLLAHLFEVARGKPGARDGRFWFSPSSFDQYAGCPFMYFLNRGLGIEPLDFETMWDDARFVGKMLHRIMAALHGQVQSRDGRWKRLNQLQYRSIALDVCEEEFERQSRFGNDFVYPMWKELKEWTRKAMEAYVEQESTLYDGYELLKSEDSLQAVIDEECGIQGRVDRVSQKDGHAVIVDYKKGTAPTRAEVYQEEMLPSTSQLPLYAFVVQHDGYKVSNAAYYSVRDGSYKHMLLDSDAPIEIPGKPVKPLVSPEEFGSLTERIVTAVTRAAEQLSRGHFTITDSCNGCDFRAVCRRKYGVRLPEVRNA
ncbi:MAG: PD-(D/E)XK nuclease family protein [bacterium]